MSNVKYCAIEQFPTGDVLHVGRMIEPLATPELDNVRKRVPAIGAEPTRPALADAVGDPIAGHGASVSSAADGAADKPAFELYNALNLFMSTSDAGTDEASARKLKLIYTAENHFIWNRTRIVSPTNHNCSSCRSCEQWIGYSPRFSARSITIGPRWLK